MARPLRWTLWSLAVLLALPLFLLSALSIWVGFIAWPDYQLVAARVAAARPLSSYPPLLVSTYLQVEDPDYLRDSGWATLRKTYALPNRRQPGMTHGSTTWILARMQGGSGARHWHLRQFGTNVALNLFLPKPQVLGAYLGTACVALTAQDGCVLGMHAGARWYFGRPLATLAPEEVALLVAVLKGPSFYSLAHSPARTKERRDLVLHRMREAGLLSNEGLQQALATPLPPARPSL